MSDSILDSTKKVCGLDPSDTSFDVDITMAINSVLNTLTQLGIGPAEGFMINDASALWVDFLGNDLMLNSVKTYVHLRVRMLFDPPVTSYAIGAMKEQIDELTYRISVHRESTQWVDPNPPPTDCDFLIDGGSV